jgi:polysaccharide export outer membrane protein
MRVRNLLRVVGLSCGVVLAALLLAGCRSNKSEIKFAEVVPSTAQGAVAAPAATNATADPAPAQAQAPAQPAPKTLPATTKASNPFPNGSAPGAGGSADYLRVGDSLTIIFSDLPQPQPPFDERINDEGNITLLYNQPFHAAGESRAQLEKEIRERYVPRYFVNLTVTVKVLDRFYFVDGEVKSPSRQPYVGPMTVLTAIGSCGDFTDFANKRKVKLTRDGHTQTINCIKALTDPRLDVPVYPNDKIHVPRRWF